MRRVAAVSLFIAISCVLFAGADYPVTPVPFTQVSFDDAFWAPRQKINNDVTIWSNLRKCEETDRFSNFEKAAGWKEGNFVGLVFNDSDAYKTLEAVAYALQVTPDPILERYADSIVTRIAAAQQPDGYLDTAYILPPKDPKKRWTVLQHDHELYCAGHFFEAATAYYQATGKRKVLDTAEKLANHIDSVFGPDKKHGTSGHPEVEMGLCRLYRATGNEKYLNLAKYFVDQRGHREGRSESDYGTYAQDHKPVVEQDEAVGHAVRACYLYAGVADVAALTGDKEYITAIDRIWDNVVTKKQYITGSVGARGVGEAFGDNYELPNKTAYNETCAAIANIFWNQRMFLLHGDAKYMDVLERVLYNGFLSGVSLKGDEYFYPNPLEADGKTKFNHGFPTRCAWFECSCCPPNIARLIASLPGYVYATKENTLYVNLYIGGSGQAKIQDTPVKLTQTTNYPWDGDIKIAVDPQREKEFTIALRIPGWTQGKPMPSDLYSYPESDKILELLIQKTGVKKESVFIFKSLLINGKKAEYSHDKGYVLISRKWNKGDIIELSLPMEIRRVLCNEKVRTNRGMVAIERGPIVFCAEGVDNGGAVANVYLPDDAQFKYAFRKDMLNGIGVITADVKAVVKVNDKMSTVNHSLVMIPYYAWSNRGAGPMRVWLARNEEKILKPTLAANARITASYRCQYDTLNALNDGLEPADSFDQSVPRFTWWDHKGTTEWVQYDFDIPTRVSGVAVYWYDEKGTADCKVPQTWKLLYKDQDGQWKAVETKDQCGTVADQYNRLGFIPVTSSALRIEAVLQAGFSGGVLEWKIKE
jgi:DUF1680 family protein